MPSNDGGFRMTSKDCPEVRLLSSMTSMSEMTHQVRSTVSAGRGAWADHGHGCIPPLPRSCTCSLSKRPPASLISVGFTQITTSQRDPEVLGWGGLQDNIKVGWPGNIWVSGGAGHPPKTEFRPALGSENGTMKPFSSCRSLHREPGGAPQGWAAPSDAAATSGPADMNQCESPGGVCLKILSPCLALHAVEPWWRGAPGMPTSHPPTHPFLSPNISKLGSHLSWLEGVCAKRGLQLSSAPTIPAPLDRGWAEGSYLHKCTRACSGGLRGNRSKRGRREATPSSSLCKLEEMVGLGSEQGGSCRVPTVGAATC